MGAGEGARDEQRGGSRGGWDFGGGLQASQCREAGIYLGDFGRLVLALLVARAGGGGGWCASFEAWEFGWSGGLRPGILKGLNMVLAALYLIIFLGYTIVKFKDSFLSTTNCGIHYIFC